MSKIDGGDLVWKAPELLLLTTNEAVKAMKKATIFTQGVAKKIAGGTGSGRLYRRRRQKGKRGSFKSSDFHRASAPGDPPARDTGILVNSISYTVKARGLLISGFVGSDIDKIRSKEPTTDPEYGFFLERGTRNISPRPWLIPSLIRARPVINKIFLGAMRAIT